MLSVLLVTELPNIFAQQEMPIWKTYINPEYRISIDYPYWGHGGLIITPNSILNQTTIYLPPSEFGAQIVVHNKTSSNSSELKQFVINQIDYIKKTSGNETIFQNIMPIKFGNQSGYTYSEIVYGFDVDGDVLIKQVFFEHGDNIFKFWFRDDMKSLDNISYERMLNSISFFD